MIKFSKTDVENIDRALMAHVKLGRNFDDEATRYSIMLEVLNQQLEFIQEESFDDPST